MLILDGSKFLEFSCQQVDVGLQVEGSRKPEYDIEYLLAASPHLEEDLPQRVSSLSVLVLRECERSEPTVFF